jgi:hypothetical protein
VDDRDATLRSEDGATGPEPERQRTIDVLCEAFANDELEVEEFERRVEAAHRAVSAEELRRLLTGLPASQLPVPAPGGQPARRAASTDPEAPDPHLGDVRDWGLSAGVMGGTTRRGYWVPARHNVAIALMGGCELDLREASLPPGVTEIYAVAMWGGVEIIVPPWIRVETSGVGIMGGFDHHQDVRSSAPPDGPVLRISGLALMAGVDVAVRYPGESARDARRRRREERKAKRLARGRGEGE